MANHRWYFTLSLLGALPFLGSVILLLLDYDSLTYIGDISYAANTYGLLIVTFMSGILWGLYLTRSDLIGINLFIVSNVITVLVWLVFLLGAESISFLFYIIVFLALNGIDLYLFRNQVINSKYFKMRCTVTLLVVSSLCFIFVLS